MCEQVLIVVASLVGHRLEAYRALPVNLDMSPAVM